jgi:hypothetical protein
MKPVYTPPIPKWLKRIGLRYYDPPCNRMKWGELIIPDSGIALSLCLFSEHYSLQIRIPWIGAFIKLPVLQRWHREPKDCMESWGFSTCDNALHLNWGSKCKILIPFWSDWSRISNDVMTSDGSWVPYVGCWENDKAPDGRHYESHPYHYMLPDGTVQHVTAKCHAERSTRKLRHLPISRTEYHIGVEFSAEVGGERGSWKGGCVGCSYTLKPGETIERCLRRMQSERRFR